jgi:hypothetical protein
MPEKCSFGNNDSCKRAESEKAHRTHPIIDTKFDFLAGLKINMYTHTCL